MGMDRRSGVGGGEIGDGQKEDLFVGWLTSQQQASVSQGRICSDNFTCCHTEIEAADQTFHLTQSQYTDTGPTGPSADRWEMRREVGYTGGVGWEGERVGKDRRSGVGGGE